MKRNIVTVKVTNTNKCCCCKCCNCKYTCCKKKRDRENIEKVLKERQHIYY